jgi:hypothetical protein
MPEAGLRLDYSPAQRHTFFLDVAATEFGDEIEQSPLAEQPRQIRISAGYLFASESQASRTHSRSLPGICSRADASSLVPASDASPHRPARTAATGSICPTWRGENPAGTGWACSLPAWPPRLSCC